MLLESTVVCELISGTTIHNTLIIHSLSLATGAAVKAGEIVSDFSAFTVNKPWEELGAGQNHVFVAMVETCRMVAGLFIMFWFLPFINKVLKGGLFDQESIQKLFWALFLILLLAGNGNLLAQVNISIRNVINNVNKSFLDNTDEAVSMRQKINAREATMSEKMILKSEVARCRSIPKGEKDDQEQSLQQQCIDEAFKKSDERIKEYNQKNEGGISIDFGKIVFNMINPVLEGILFLIFSTFQLAFSFIIEIAMLLNVDISPLFFALSFLPKGEKFLYTWFSGWTALGILKISYSLIIGIVATMVTNEGENTFILMPFLFGFLSPLLAVSIATGGGIATFNSLSSAVSGGLRLLLKLGVKGGL